MLSHTHFGDQDGVPLLIAHGLFGSARNWRGLGRALSRDRWVITVDMRNHGQSFWDNSNKYPDMADDLAQIIQEYGGQADVLGHSMGGKAAMCLALQMPDLINRLIVADIAPVTYSHSQTPVIDMLLGLDLGNYSRRAEVQAEIAAQTGDPGLAAFLAQSFQSDDTGNRWSLNLPILRAFMDDIIGFPDMHTTYEKPCLFLRGDQSDYASGPHEAAAQRLFPNLTFEDLESAGHWLHADQPKPFLEAVNAYLD